MKLFILLFLLSTSQVLGENLVEKLQEYVKEKFQTLQDEVKETLEKLSDKFNQEVQIGEQKIEQIYLEANNNLLNIPNVYDQCIDNIKTKLGTSKIKNLQNYSDCPGITGFSRQFVEYFKQGVYLIENLANNLDDLVKKFASCVGIYPIEVAKCLFGEMKEIPIMFQQDFDAVKSYTKNVWTVTVNITETIGECLHIIDIKTEVDQIMLLTDNCVL